MGGAPLLQGDPDPTHPSLTHLSPPTCRWAMWVLQMSLSTVSSFVCWLGALEQERRMGGKAEVSCTLDLRI